MLQLEVDGKPLRNASAQVCMYIVHRYTQVDGQPENIMGGGIKIPKPSKVS